MESAAQPSTGSGTRPFHNANRPKSSLSNNPYSGWTTNGLSANTGPSGSLPIYIKTTIVGQAEAILNCPSGGLYPCATYEFAVGYQDIYYVEEKTQWKHIGGNTTNHGGNEYNHWMTSAAAYGIWYTAVDYLATHSQQGKIAVNDMALPFGGIFDIGQNWQAPHASHSRGTAVDVRGNGAEYSIPFDQQETFTELCTDNGAVHAAVESVGSTNRHIHCRWPD